MDLQDVLKLLDLMESRHLDEIEVEQEGVRIRLKKGGATPPPVPIVVTPVAAVNPQGNSGAAPAGREVRPGRVGTRQGHFTDGRHLLPRAVARRGTVRQRRGPRRRLIRSSASSKP